jgi:hypothetical protein
LGTGSGSAETTGEAVNGRRLSVLSVLSVASGTLTAQANQCPDPPRLPAYSHNDYYNRHPLLDAIALGYRGVEADYIVSGGELLAAHSRREARPSRTLEAPYLQPLREIIRRCGRVYPDSAPFLLAIEDKEGGRESYAILRELLLRYSDILSTDGWGGRRNRPVQVILVGRHPPLAELDAESLRVVAVQGRLGRSGAELPEGPALLVELLSLNYGQTLRWRGHGVMYPEDRQVLEKLTEARRDNPGIRIRAFNVPPNRAIYHEILRSIRRTDGPPSP